MYIQITVNDFWLNMQNTIAITFLVSNEREVIRNYIISNLVGVDVYKQNSCIKVFF